MTEIYEIRLSIIQSCDYIYQVKDGTDTKIDKRQGIKNG